MVTEDGVTGEGAEEAEAGEGPFLPAACCCCLRGVGVGCMDARVSCMGEGEDGGLRIIRAHARAKKKPAT